MTCIPLERLRSFRRQELSEDERRLVELHLSECRTCRQTLVENLRLEDTPVPEPIPDEILRQVRSLVPEPRRAAGPIWLAVAALLVALVGGMLLYPKSEPEPVLRDLDPVSEHLEPIAPTASAEVRGLVRFRWTAVSNATLYRLVILGADGSRLLEKEADDTAIEIETDLLDAGGGTLYWLVEAQLPGGHQLTSTPRALLVAGGVQDPAE